MRGVKHFIVHVPQTHDEKIKTESGVVLYADKRFSTNETTNNVFKVSELPLDYDGPIQKGWELMVDPSLVFQQTYEKGGTQENIYLINREKSLYKVEPSLVICFRESAESKWTGFGNNVICSPVKAEKKDFEKIGSLYVPDQKIPKSVKGQMEVVINNESLKENGISENDVVFVDQKYAVPLIVDGKSFIWLRTKEILAKNNAA